MAQMYWIDHTENYYRTLQLATKYDGKEYILLDKSNWAIPVFHFEEEVPKQPSFDGYKCFLIKFPNGGSENIDLGFINVSDILYYLKNSLMPKYNLTITRYEGSIEGKKYEGYVTR